MKALSIVLLILSLACTTHFNNKKNGSTVIRLPQSVNSLYLSELISDIDTLELNFENDRIFIGDILSMKIIGNKIFIKHRLGNLTSILNFNTDGSNIDEIGEIGRGPGEIMNPRDIIAYEDGYALWDNIGVHKFKKDGKYEKFLFNANIPGNCFFYYSNYFYFMHELTYPGFLSKYSSNGKLEQVFKPLDFNFGNLEYSNILSYEDRSFLLVSPLTDTIYSFTEDKLAIRYILDCSPNKSFGRVLIETANLNPLEQLKAINRNMPVTLTSFMENEDYIYLTYRIKNEEMHFVSNKTNKESIVFSKVVNDLNNYSWGKPIFLSDDNWLYVPVSVTELVEKNSEYPNTLPVHNELHPDNQILNPIIIKYQLKF